jgi:hypothetical protein
MIKLEANFLRGSYTPPVTPFRDSAVDHTGFLKRGGDARECTHGREVANHDQSALPPT